jgi:tetratricopeptide (TPR) repeat protein
MQRFNNSLRAVIASVLLAVIPSPSVAQQASVAHVRTLYNSIPVKKWAPLLALAMLYPKHTEAQSAMQEVALSLWQKSVCTPTMLQQLHLAAPAIIAMLELHPRSFASSDSENAALQIIRDVGAYLPHRALTGHSVTKIADLKNLPSDQIDLARSLLICEIDDTPEGWQAIARYEAQLDLWAMQIAIELPLACNDTNKVTALNTLIFEHLGFRFPPLSRYTSQIDQYTCLSAVIDGRQGVCLGVTLLYLCLAQRLGLNLEIATPPGHIFLRCRHDGTVTNIETTAHGIHIDDEEYLGMSLRSLPLRNLKEVIGLAHVNRASTFLLKDDYTNALKHYSAASCYVTPDQQLLELTALSNLLLHNNSVAEELLKQASQINDPCSLYPSTLIEDLMRGVVTAEDARLLYTSQTNKREALDTYRRQLEDMLQRNPRFRLGWLQLAQTWMELQRPAQAMQALMQCDALDNDNLQVVYLLTQLAAERYDYPAAWLYFDRASHLCHIHNHHPKALDSLRRSLITKCAR